MSCGFLSAHHFKDACPFSNLLTSNISLSCAILALRTFDHQNKNVLDYGAHLFIDLLAFFKNLSMFNSRHLIIYIY